MFLEKKLVKSFVLFIILFYFAGGCTWTGS